MVNMMILGPGFGFLPMKILAKQKWDMSGVDNVIWGVRRGPPWSQMVAVSVLDTDGVG